MTQKQRDGNALSKEGNSVYCLLCGNDFSQWDSRGSWQEGLVGAVVKKMCGHHLLSHHHPSHKKASIEPISSIPFPKSIQYLTTSITPDPQATNLPPTILSNNIKLSQAQQNITMNQNNLTSPSNSLIQHSPNTSTPKPPIISRHKLTLCVSSPPALPFRSCGKRNMKAPLTSEVEQSLRMELIKLERGIVDSTPAPLRNSSFARGA